MTGPANAPDKVLVITRNLPPLVGGMERLLHNAIRELSAEFHVSVIGPGGCQSELPGIDLVREVDPYPLWRFLARCLILGITVGRRTRPRAVFAGSGLTAPIALLAARLTGAVAVAQLHGLDLVVRSRLYRLLFVASFRFLDVVLVNSANTARLATEKRVPPDKIRIVHPGVALPGPVDEPARQDFVQRYNLLDKRVLLSVGRLTPRKGLSAFITHCMPTILRDHKDTVLLLAGGAAKDALKKDIDEPAAIEDAIASLGLHEHVVRLGPVSDDVLNHCYASSDIFVFPAVSVPGDVEGFGMVAVEAAAWGLPTVAFDVGGITDAVQHGYSGYLVPPLDYAGFTQRITRLLEDPDLISAEHCRQHSRQFSVANFGRRLRGVFRDALVRRTGSADGEA